MSKVVITSIPVTGHVTPLLALSEALVDAGHDVRFLTGARFADRVRATGAEHVSLPRESDFDDREMGEDTSQRSGLGVLTGLRDGVREILLRPVPGQYRALVELVESPTDVVVSDAVYVGAALLALRPRVERPPVIAVSTLPLLMPSPDVAPYGMALPPLTNRLINRLRNRTLQHLAERVVFRPVHQDFESLVRELVGRPPGSFVLDGLRPHDLIVQLGPAGFEYPRTQPSNRVEFVGPLIPASTGPVPDWWPDLEQDRPVVLVTQGTVANRDASALLRPTIDALADDDVLVVASMGGRPVSDLGPLPANARAASYLPYDRLFPHLDALVTNGGYGGVQHALAYGVPVVVAGTTADEPEVGARVAWTGCGINLHTARPRRSQVRRAVHSVLADPAFRTAARGLADEIAHAGGIGRLCQIVEQVTMR